MKERKKMKIDSKVMSIGCLVLGLVLGSNNFAMSNMPSQKIAVVDVPAIVAKSAQVKALKDEQAKKAQDLAKWLETVNADVKKQSTEANKQKLLKKYNEDLAKKKEANTKEYTKKLAAIDASISSTIAAQAKAKGYDIVLAKSTVLYGGEDITSEIAKIVK